MFVFHTIPFQSAFPEALLPESIPLLSSQRSQFFLFLKVDANTNWPTGELLHVRGNVRVFTRVNFANLLKIPDLRESQPLNAPIDHFELRLPHLFQVFRKALVLLNLPGVTVSWKGHNRHYCWFLLLITHHYVWVVGQRPLDYTELDVPQDLSFAVLSHFRWCLVWGPSQGSVCL